MVSLFSPSDLATLRQLALSAMPDSGRIVRPAAGGSLDPDGVWIPGAASTVYVGPVRVRPATTQEVSRLFGDDYVSTVDHAALLPHDAPVVRVGDELHVVAGSDPQITAVRFKVEAVAHSSYLIERQIGLETIE